MKVRISSIALQQIIDRAAAAPAAEICGLLFGKVGIVERAVACPNVASDPARAFEIDPACLITAYRGMRESGARVVGHYHSHPTGSAEPSWRDAAAAAADGAFWLIVGDGEVGGWRAVENGSVKGRFEPIELDVVVPGCTGATGQPEGPSSGIFREGLRDDG